MMYGASMPTGKVGSGDVAGDVVVSSESGPEARGAIRALSVMGSERLLHPECMTEDLLRYDPLTLRFMSDDL
jgi:hypothetical protein